MIDFGIFRSHFNYCTNFQFSKPYAIVSLNHTFFRDLSLHPRSTVSFYCFPENCINTRNKNEGMKNMHFN